VIGATWKLVARKGRRENAIVYRLTTAIMFEYTVSNYGQRDARRNRETVFSTGHSTESRAKSRPNAIIIIVGKDVTNFGNLRRSIFLLVDDKTNTPKLAFW